MTLSLTPEEARILRQWRRRIGQNIQRGRMRRHMRLEACAAQAGVPMSQLDRYECGGGEIPIPLLVRLAVILGLPLEELLA